MAKINKDSQYKKIFKWDNRKKQSQSSDEIKGKSKSNMVLIEYNHAPGKVHQKQEIKDSKSSDKNHNDKYFSGYINRVKNKMRTTTSNFDMIDDGGSRKPTIRRDSFNDTISHYINRAKLKIRTTTIVSRSDHK
ncbi:uncharacterized protein LOC125874029 [Solanum stenotomum]|nr:uncharacterized protein LOC125874029 [Solanum stenotomum]